MNVLSLALGGLTGGSSGPPLASSILSATAALLAQQAFPAAGASGATSRDTAISGELGLSPAINALQQFATAQATGGSNTSASSAQALQLPPLPPMPAPAKAPDVPSDDHGQSNIVFSDAGGDGTLIH
jgi:hypothetical protein